MAERPLTELIRPGAPLSMADYEAAGGYEGLRKALSGMTPPDVQKAVTESNLRGRGGAGFPTGQKWSFVPMGEGAQGPKYFIVNADEMEPGTFKDRVLLEGNPHQIVEGAILGAYAIGASFAYIFLRWEYRRAEKALGQAVADAYRKGYLGKNILGSGFDLELRLHSSAGRYICGEETALLNALEGRRAVPRSKPPFPQVSGLWGRPTIVNNAETVANIPHIIRKGAAWYRSLSGSADSGTKLYGVSGRVKRPGLWELPIGVTVRELLYEYAGGMLDGFGFRGVIPGGASTDFLVERHLDVEMDYSSLQKAGSRLGTGTMIILDDRTCPVGMVHNIVSFLARESCGWCTPCREGLPWAAKILNALEKGDGMPGDIEILEEHTRLLGIGNTYCALAPGAMEPLQSALLYFRDDFDRHVSGKGCPWR